MASGGMFYMAETEPIQTEQETKTAADLQFEQLNKRLDSIEATYQARIKELEEANRGLWAQLHPVIETVTAAPEPVAVEPQEDKAETALFDALGMKKE